MDDAALRTRPHIRVGIERLAGPPVTLLGQLLGRVPLVADDLRTALLAEPGYALQARGLSSDSVLGT
jgi:hypothetical protein